MVQKWHIQLYGVSSGTAKPCRSIHQNCKVRLNHVLRKKRFFAFGSAVLFFVGWYFLPAKLAKNTSQQEQCILSAQVLFSIIQLVSCLR